MNIIERLMIEEGFSPTAYRCPSGKLTVGYGLNIDPDGGGITEREAKAVLILRVDDCEKDLIRIFSYPVWMKINDVRKNALLDMRYQLGYKGFRSFKNMIAAIRQFDWITASEEAKDSLWYRQVTRRAEVVCDELASGIQLG